METIHEHAQACQSARFPRATALLEILALAELFRDTAVGLDALAESGWRYEPTSLRSAAVDRIREAIDEIVDSLPRQVAL